MHLTIRLWRWKAGEGVVLLNRLSAREDQALSALRLQQGLGRPQQAVLAQYSTANAQELGGQALHAAPQGRVNIPMPGTHSVFSNNELCLDEGTKHINFA